MITDKDREEANNVWKALTAQYGDVTEKAAIEIARIRQESYNQGRKDATSDAMGYGISASERGAIRAEAKRESAEKAVAFVDNNYNMMGEWDCVAFDNLRSAILGDSPVKENLKGDAEKLASAIQYLEEITKRNDSHECYRLANEALREIRK